MPRNMIGEKMNRKTRQTFKSEFRLEVAQIVVNHGYSVREASDAMNVGNQLLING